MDINAMYGIYTHSTMLLNMIPVYDLKGPKLYTPQDFTKACNDKFK